MRTKKEIFKDILKVKGDTALLDAKYIGVSADDIIDCYHELNISSPINLIENTWLQRYRSSTGTANGCGNGYVRICEGHPFYGKEYDEIPVDVHGGLTYSALTVDDGKFFTKGFWIGFDTAHHSDTLLKWPKDAVYEETLYLFKQIYSV